MYIYIIFPLNYEYSKGIAYTNLHYTYIYIYFICLNNFLRKKKRKKKETKHGVSL